MTSLLVDGSPDSCRGAARELRRLEARTASVAEHLAGVQSTAAGGWHGAAGDAFRGRVKSAMRQADLQAARLRLVGAALGVLADRLDGVRAMMGEARALARAAGLPVTGDALPHAVDVPPERAEALARAVAVAVRARDRETRAQTDWLAALDEAFPPGEVSGFKDQPLVERLQRSERSWPDLADSPLDRVVDLELPVAIPMVPLPRRPFLGIKDVLLPIGRATTGQIRDDLDREDLTLTERLARGAFVGTTTGVGAVGGIALCARIGVTRRSAPTCGKAGGWLGKKAGTAILERIDAH